MKILLNKHNVYIVEIKIFMTQKHTHNYGKNHAWPSWNAKMVRIMIIMELGKKKRIQIIVFKGPFGAAALPQHSCSPCFNLGEYLLEQSMGSSCPKQTLNIVHSNHLTCFYRFGIWGPLKNNKNGRWVGLLAPLQITLKTPLIILQF